MKIELKEISVRDLYDGYRNDDDEGVVGYHGKLNIRPKYQREFIYKDSQREEVIHTVRKGFPLNVMYWVKNKDGNFELLDGQQRTLSICSYIYGEFAINWDNDLLGFHNLSDDRRDKILGYKIMVYVCEGTDSEILDWFKIVNIAGERLTLQEMRNAVYTGEWLTDAKRYFSKNNCAASGLGSYYMSGVPIRQEYLETAIEWICDGREMVESYMLRHQNEKNANELWLYFKNVIDWVQVVFPKRRKEMKGIGWGFLYNKFKNKKLDATELEIRISKLMQDEDVSNKKGIYEYVLEGEEKHLRIRLFSDSMKRSAYEKQKGICAHCKKRFEIEDMEADHITPWHLGGKTSPENCQMLCRECNRRKSGK